MMDEFMGSFIAEVKELLLQLEDDLMGLENNPGNTEIINNIFRVMHTLKGTAGMMGFKNIQDLTHEFESLYEQIRSGKLDATSGIIDITLKGKDLINNMLEGENVEDDARLIVYSIRELIDIKKTDKSEDSSGKSDAINMQNFFIILFSPEKKIFERGLDPDKALLEVSSAGKNHILAHETGKSWNKQKIVKVCRTSWEIYLNTRLDISGVTDIFLFYEQDEYRIFQISATSLHIPPELAEKLNKLYKNNIDTAGHIKDCLKIIADFQETPASVKENKANSGLEVTNETTRIDADATVNVSSHKLDELMNLVSELVTLTATIESHVSRFNDSKLNSSIESIEKLTKKFRNNALDLRLVQVGTLLTKFKRQVRDLSKELGKKVNLIIEGQDIEIDKTILKSIESPLQHIIRNSIDHGIEDEETRLAKGKPGEGILKIFAFYSGASVIIQVQDDGNGINLDRVKECAIKKGMITPDQAVSKQDLINLIIEPGFTTNENISMVSGRGVGMDVVKRELNAVGGSLEIFTEKDLGTSITMKLPMTLTIIDTLMVDVGESQILIPVMDIEYCFKQNAEDLFEKDNKYVQYKNNPIPLISLREQFRYAEFDEKDIMIIVINKFDRRYAIAADKIVGEHQAVIKPLGDLFVNQPFFSGGSIMVDGKMALILDTNFLFNNVKKYNN